MAFQSPYCQAQTPSKIGQFDNFTHIGNPDKKGIALYDAKTQEYQLEGASGNMWANKDDFYFLWNKMKGDFILTFQAEFIGKGVDPHRKVGWMVRKTADANSPHINAVVHGDGLMSLQYRRTEGGITEQTESKSKGTDVVQLERKGNLYIMSVAHWGEPFVRTEYSDIDLGDDVMVGLFLCSHNDTVVEKAILRNVRIVIPARENFVPYREYIGSHVELMDVEKGRRQILHSENRSLQAPNWTVNGKELIYNAEGLLYNFDLKTNTPSVLNTDFAKRNNNDHVLSFDGKQIAISNHSEEDKGVSMVYTVSRKGGKPKKITTKGPSYLHGWTPDAKSLVFTGGRDGEFDIYKIPAKGGAEINLTKTKGLDDGPEYSPDGKYIYFNSTRSGLMQLWRMKPDGSEQTQLTNDEYNNWFPHISPDGKWIAFISYAQDVKPEDHPFYKHVYLRLMPVGGGTPKVIAYLYGGQGTINVPSWSPDSKRIAFVSNTQMPSTAAQDSIKKITQADHQKMLNLLGIKELRAGANGSDPKAPNAANYDESKANPYPILPDPLTLKNGQKVTSSKMWWDLRRPEIVEDFDREIYGRVPKNTPSVKWQILSVTQDTVSNILVVTKKLVGHVDNAAYSAISVDIQLTLTTPANATKPVPVMMELSFVRPPGGFSRPPARAGDTVRPTPPPPTPTGPTWQQQVLEKGWGYAILIPTSIQADNGAGLTQGIIGLMNKGQSRKADDWGSLRAWAWGASRALDYFETDKAVNAKQVAIEGHSRYGKAAIVTLAYDARFAIGFISSSGEGGVKLHRRNAGEIVENVAGSGEYHWMAGNFIKYAAAPLTWNDMPVDAHELVALCAPRPIFISSGEKGDAWVDAKGMFMAGAAAGPVYKLLGKKDLGTTEMPKVEMGLMDGDISFRQHSGGHTPAPNWATFLDFASRYFK